MVRLAGWEETTRNKKAIDGRKRVIAEEDGVAALARVMLNLFASDARTQYHVCFAL